MKSITTRQLCVLLILTIISTKCMVLPSLLSGGAGNDGLIVLGLFTFFELVIISLFISLAKNNESRSLKVLVESCMWKWLSKTFMTIAFIFFVFKLFLALKEGQMFLSETIYSEFSFVQYFVPLLAICCYISIKGLKTLSRTTEVIVPFIIIGTLFIIFISFKTVKFDNVLPLFTHSSGQIFDTAFKNLIWFGDYFVIFGFIGKIKIEKDFSKKIWTATIFAILIVIIFNILFFSTFGITALYHRHAITDVLQFGPEVAEISKIDWFATIVWTMIIFMQTSIFFYNQNYLLKYIFSFKNWRLQNLIFLVIAYIALYFTIPLTLEDVIEFTHNYLAYFIAVTSVVFTIALTYCTLRYKSNKFRLKVRRREYYAKNF